jgi:transposase
MTDEEAIQLKQAFADLQQAFLNLQEEVAQKDRRIEELEALLMRALLRNDELERRQAKIVITVASRLRAMA